jgi:hypothetical protein
MAAEVKLGLIIEALEMADDSVSSYMEVETGEVRPITEEEFDLAEDPQTVIEELPDWQRPVTRQIRQVPPAFRQWFFRRSRAVLV